MNKFIIKKQYIKIYNSLTRKKDIFYPLYKNCLGIYVCGPTVYKDVHLGNCRTFVFFDILVRYFRYLGYNTRYVRNITDVGHLRGNIDKIQQQSIIEKLEPMEIAQKYTVNFHKIENMFNLLSPNIEPIASGHIIDQIKFIKNIINNGFAYENQGSVYFNIKKYNKYFKYGLFNNINFNYLNIKDNSFNSDKINQFDFSLWRKASNNELMKWPSPWGEGFPGWHIECSAMSSKYLSPVFDIHGGGVDLKFPHHECEIAQNMSIYNKKLANYWMHTNMLTFNHQKVSKSKNNFFTLNSIINNTNKYFTKEFNPMVLKFFLLQSHYRNVLNISNKSLLQAEKNYYYILKSISILNTSLVFDNNSEDNILINKWCQNCYISLNDDFNTPLLISLFILGCKYVRSILQGEMNLNSFDLKIFQFTFNIFFFQILGFKKKYKIENINNFYQLINLLIKIRHKHREAKDWDTADLIRKELLCMGVDLHDKNNETVFSFNS